MAAPRAKYRIPNPAKYQRLHENHLKRACDCRAHAVDGTRLNHWNLSIWQQAALEAAGGALAFQHGDSVVRAHFADALEASRFWIRSGTPWRPRPQPVDPTVTRHDLGDVIFEVTEMPPRMADIGWIQDWDLVAFGRALRLFIAFGTRDEAGRAAETPEVAYRSPDMVSSESAYNVVRALKVWALDQFEDARAACRHVLDSQPPRVPRQFATGLAFGRANALAEARAVVAMLDGQRAALLSALDELETSHNKMFASTPLTAERFYSLPGLALARMASRHGLEVPERLLIPTRLLRRWGIDTADRGQTDTP